MGAAPKLQAFQIVEKLDSLPTLPSIVYELNRVISNPMSSTGDVETIMGNDQAMTAKVLRLANSAYYAIPGGVSNLKRAIAYIGYDAIHQLVLASSIINSLNSKESAAFDPKEFWKHSLGVAIASETIAKGVHYSTPSDLFTCGLVHDLGKLALYILVPDVFTEAVIAARTKGISSLEAEELLEIPRHTLVGRELAAKWKLPATFQAAISYHHERDTAKRGGISSEMNLLVDIVYLGNILVTAMKFGNSGHDKVYGVPKDVLERLAVDQEKLKTLVSNVKEAMKNADAFLKIIGS